MNVLLIAECTKNALTQTRRILDQFAERRGTRTWQTPITQEGLTTLHRLLRQTARKNTAVACHWIRGRDHSELLWIVGDASRFNMQGAAPTNRTESDVLRGRDEDDWHTGEEIRLLSSLGALFHDLGKANRAFQNKLKPRGNKPVVDAFRHEWVSLRLFQAFVGEAGDDREWLERLLALGQRSDSAWLDNLLRDGLDDEACDSPFDSMPPLAKVVGWLILTHHRLPARGYKEIKEAPLTAAALKTVLECIEPNWNSNSQPPADVESKQAEKQRKKAEKDTWTFDKGLPFQSKSWCRHASRLAERILARAGMVAAGEQWLANPFALHVARLALMLADHYYSSGPSLPRYGDVDYPLFANTQNGELKQHLDEHLIGVEVNAGRILRTLPRLEHALPRIARHKRFRRRTKEPQFRWQDRAYDLACGLRFRSARQGFFGVDMASTGCGKTLANGRILYGLANPQRGARFSIALGLRTLTLQTGDVYRERLGLGAEDLAVLAGMSAVRELHERNRAEEPEPSLAAAGSESVQALLPDDSYVHFAGSLEDGPLNRWLGTNPRAQRLLNAPILACTIDHLMPATEGTRGGQQIAPMLRLMSSDLVLDEPDDFGLEDLPALTRLVYWAGLLGSRVLLSSATLPPALVQGLFEAYLEGRRGYQQNRGIPGQPLNVCCAWFDEFAVAASDHADKVTFLESHSAFVDQRLRKLSQARVRRKAAIRTLPIKSHQHDEICAGVAEFVHRALHELHAKHHTPHPNPITGKRVSFGLVRMANIDPLVDVVRALHGMGAKTGYRVHLCCYHSQYPLIVRSAIEQRLDWMLDRQEPNRIFDDPELQAQLAAADVDDHVFVVLATAVAEVGRDHDYDWAIVEPSSMRSIIQLAGRVRRHRPEPCAEPNIYLLDTNVRHLKKGLSEPAFCRPGFESKEFPLRSHQLSDLLTQAQLQVIDSSARIRERKRLQPEDNLIDLEHAQLRALLLGEPAGEERRIVPAHWWWTTQASLTGELQRRQPFRNDPLGRQRYMLLPREDDRGQDFYRIERDGNLKPVTDSLMHELEIERAAGIESWGTGDFSELLEALAEEFGLDAADAARRFATVELPEKGTEQGWFYHPALGFSRYRSV